MQHLAPRAPPLDQEGQSPGDGLVHQFHNDEEVQAPVVQYSKQLQGHTKQGISIDVLYNREFKSDDEVNISAEDKDVDVTIATDDHNRDFIFIRLRLIYMLRFARLSMWANLKNEDDLT